MKVMIVGSGGREHALAWKCAQSSRVTEVVVAPGNAGTAREPKLRNIAVAVDDVAGLVALAQREAIDLTIIGPEAPLVLGVVDAFEAAGLRCFGPHRAPAQLEGSKAFTKEFLRRHGIPTAAYATFTADTFDADWVRKQRSPIVVKASGLAAGKGVIIAGTADEAIDAARSMFEGQFGGAGAEVVIEEFLPGEEASFIVIADGVHALPFATSQDHKRIGDGDTGPNTGGMGAYSPAPVVDDVIYQRVMDEVIYPTVKGMAEEGNDYTGFLYAGLMIMADGTPKVIEYNCRFGDPETQPILMRLKSDLVGHCLAALDGGLHKEQANWDPRPAVGIVLAAGGYPESYASGETISGLDDVQEDASAKVFHAGTKFDGDNVVTSGGRVLCAVALGASVAQAQERAYSLAHGITWNDVYSRSDIGHRAIAREQQGLL